MIMMLIARTEGGFESQVRRSIFLFTCSCFLGFSECESEAAGSQARAELLGGLGPPPPLTALSLAALLKGVRVQVTGLLYRIFSVS